VNQTLVLAAILLSAAPARADFVYKLAGYRCDPQADAVVLTYMGARNQEGKRLMKQKGPGQWDPWSLLTKSKDGNSIVSQKTVQGQCRLRDGLYEITIGPAPGNANLQGMCGGFITAWAEVRRGAETVWRRQTFESGDCHAAAPVTTKVVLHSGGKPPVVTKVPFEDFIK
jgi:hypothetical protein